MRRVSHNLHSGSASTLLTALLIVLVAAVASAQGPTLERVPADTLAAFELRSAHAGVMSLDWDLAAVRAAAGHGRAVRVPSFALAEGLSVELELEPFSITGPNTRFVLGRLDGPDEPLDFDPSSIALFRGRVAGRPGSRVFLALAEGSPTGYVDLGPGHPRYRLSSKGAAGEDLPAGRLTVFRTVSTASASLPPGVPLCGLEDAVDLAPALPRGVAKSTVVPGPGIKHLELAVETDHEYFQLFGDATAAATYLVELYAEVSSIYLRDVDVWVELVFARIWDQPNDPFDGADPLPEFRSYWNNNMTSVARDTAQMFSGRRNYPFGGQASLSVLCSQTSGYSVVGYATGFFPDPTQPSPFNYDIAVTAHEIGHNAGTGHTHDNGIDDCNDPLTTPQRGTIMSYCGQTFSGQNANRDLYFHGVVQQNIDNHVASRSCLPDDCNLNAVDDALDTSNATSADANGNGVPDECEDCNANGVLDPTDIAGASADVNGNAIPDECEPDCNLNGLPDDWDISQGTSSDAYRNDIPDECEADCNANVLSDYTEIQLDMGLDIDRNAVLDSCQDCDNDGTSDLDAFDGGHGLWIASGQASSQIRRFYASSGVREATSTGALVNQAQDLIWVPSRSSVLVTSAGDNRVMEFDRDGTYLGDLVASGSGGLSHPAGLVLTPDGSTLLVSSHDTGNVLSYDVTTGAFLGEFVTAGSGGLSGPFGLTFDRDGNLYVTADTNEVLRYDGTGVFIDVFVNATANGGLNQPRGLTFKGDGNLLVASFGSDEVLEYQGTTGAALGKWAQVGTATVLTQTSPWNVRVAPGGNVFVSRTGEDFGGGGGGNHDHLDGGAGLHLTEAVIYEFNVGTGNFVRTHIGGADHQAIFPTGFDFIPGWDVDCNLSLLPDSCEIASGASLDTDLNGVPDECELDCNANGSLDRLDIIPYGTSFDCNANQEPDECDLASGTSMDADMNGVPDECQCGNGICESGEDCTSCAADCPSLPLPGASCGNGICEAADGEDCTSCAADCNGQQGGKPAGRFCCGFGGENPVGCGNTACTSGGFACTETPAGPGGNTCCGDFFCEGPEDGFSCAVDCGPPPVCGDAVCDPGEDTCSCATDCGTPPASEAGFCTDGNDNDCDLTIDCADPDCAGDAACQVDCSTLTDKNTCNAEPACNWDNRNKVCLPA